MSNVDKDRYYCSKEADSGGTQVAESMEVENEAVGSFAIDGSYNIGEMDVLFNFQRKCTYQGHHIPQLRAQDLSMNSRVVPKSPVTLSISQS